MATKERIILDTSSILFAMSQKKDIFEAISEEYPGREIVLSTGIFSELRKLASTKKKNARDASAALVLLKHKRFATEDDDSYVDDWILRESGRTGTVVCTNDTALRGKLRGKGVKTISMSIGGRLR